jgi:hypothetical protein
MKPFRCLAAVILALVIAVPSPADDPKEAGFVPMFDGHTLKGWVNVNCASGTFFVKDNQIITTGKPTGYLRTEKQYENFIAEFDWMHIPPKPGAVGNSGFFVWADPIPAVGTGYTRGIEVQVLVNLTYKNKKGEITATSQGDLFSIHGASCVPERPHPDGWARCLPSENHCKGEGEWNHYRVEANDGVIKLAVNGHFVSSVSKCKPRKGYLALESEGSECRFKNLKIKELPSTNPKKDEICDVAQGHKALYTGLDLSGWKAADEVKKHWQARDTVLHYDGKGEAKDNALRTEKEFADSEYVVDFRAPQKLAKPCGFGFRAGDGLAGVSLTFEADKLQSSVIPIGVKLVDDPMRSLKPAGQWNRLRVRAQDHDTEVQLNGRVIYKGKQESSAPRNQPGKWPLALHPQGEMDFANLFVRELK